jgi:hypothetical protein
MREISASKLAMSASEWPWKSSSLQAHCQPSTSLRGKRRSELRVLLRAGTGGQTKRLVPGVYARPAAASLR